MHLDVEIEEQTKYYAVEDRIESPSSHSIAPTFDKMEEKDPKMADQVAGQKHHLAIHHEREAGARQPNGGPESVPVEGTGEVKDVRPEEHAPRRTRTERETEEPLEWGGDGLGAAPEPARVSNLGGGGVEDAGENYGRDKRNTEAVDGWDWSKGDASPFGENERKETMEGDIGDNVDGDGGEEEGPRGAKRLGVIPTEVDDGRMLR
ncbi:hypothetical protein V6N12_051087 [Hibiscus sabdariffa]|uniref:Uncharacterized protein n=1 Tax=Hibiscus sabdariffa TaxID=183260 RepID=A0ABR2GFK4_9ROSI